MGAGDKAQPQDTVIAFALVRRSLRRAVFLSSGGRKSGVMEAVNEGAKNADGNALTIGILPGKDKKQLSDCVDVGIRYGDGQREEQHQHSVERRRDRVRLRRLRYRVRDCSRIEVRGSL